MTFNDIHHQPVLAVLNLHWRGEVSSVPTERGIGRAAPIRASARRKRLSPQARLRDSSSTTTRVSSLIAGEVTA